jgi:hypothetical protein
VLQPKVVDGPRVEILCRPEARHGGLVNRYLNLERREDPGPDVLAHGMNVINPSRKTLSPDDSPVSGIHEFDRHHDASIRYFHRSPWCAGTRSVRAYMLCASVAMH